MPFIVALKIMMGYQTEAETLTIYHTLPASFLLLCVFELKERFEISARIIMILLSKELGLA